MLQPLKMIQPRIGDLGVVKAQVGKFAQPFELLQPGVRHFGVIKLQFQKLSQPLDVLQANIRDFRPIETQDPQVASSRRDAPALRRSLGCRNS